MLLVFRGLADGAGLLDGTISELVYCSQDGGRRLK